MSRGLVPAAAVLILLTLCVGLSPASAKPEYTRRTKKECGFCHPPGGYNLNEAGKYYRDHMHSLKGYEPPSSR